MMTKPGDLLLNRYKRIRLLGSGGFGAVYLAEDTRLGRAVAIKEMDAERLAPAERAPAEQMFEREARMLASLDHPGLTRIWDFFQADRCAYLVMEYVPGQTLRELLNRHGGPLDQSLVLECALQLCDVLQYLHSRRPQVIFRDLKPANVMVVEQQTDPAFAPEPLSLRLIDFGIARLFNPDRTADTLIIGTPGYAPPEQYGQGQTDQRSDIYSLGATLHQLLSGQAPGAAPPPPLTTLNPAVAPDLARIIARATAYAAADRYPCVEDLRADLLALRPAPTPAPRATPATPSAAPTAPRATPRAAPPPPLALPNRPTPARTSALGLVLAVLAIVAIGAIGVLGLRAFGQITGPGAGGAPGPAPTVPPASQEWLLPGASGQIAFGQQGQGGFDVWVATLGGEAPRRLTNDQRSYSPAWSPDGTQLAITHDRDIYIGTAANPMARQIQLGGLQARYPAWSPDGTQLALATSASANGPWRLAIITLASGAISYPDAPDNIAGLAWAPGSRLVFAAPADAGQPQDLFVLDVGRAVNITNTPDTEEDLPNWSPNGRRLAFTSSPAGANQLNLRQITLINPDGSGRQQLTFGAGPHTNAVWSPDGAWIAYLAKETSPDWQVWAMRADGSAPRVLTFGPERKFYLSWGPA